MHGHYIPKNRATPLGKCTENASNTVLFPLRRGMDWYIAFVTYLALRTPPTTEICGRAPTEFLTSPEQAHGSAQLGCLFH